MWLLPATVLVWVFYVLPMWLIARDLKFVEWYDFLVADFVLAKEGVEPWHAKLWRDWAGWSGPCVMLRKPEGNEAWDRRTRIHEHTHCLQQFRWGLLYYPAYFLASVWIWLFGGKTKNAYYDNPFEREARREAGQTVDIPPDQWMDGPRDRWAWW